MSKLNDSTEKYFFNYLKEHNNFLTDQEYHSIAHKAAQIPDTFIDYEKRDEIHVFFGIHPSKARLNIRKPSKLLSNKIYIQKN